MIALVDVAQEAARSLPSQPTPFSILELGKSLFTLSFFTLVTVVMTARGALAAGRGSDEARRKGDLGLFWGVFTMVAGLFHVFMSLSSTTWSVQLYGPIGPDQQWLVARAVMLAMLAGAWGTLVFLFASLTWLWSRRRSGPQRRSAPAGIGHALEHTIGP